MDHITLSIITVNYNDKNGLIKTLQSVQSQSFADYEHIIIDGGSTDGSVEVIRQYATDNSYVTYWHSQPDKGIYDGMNIGIAHASGMYLCFMNGGDCFTDDILAKINLEGADLIWGDTTMVKGDDVWKETGMATVNLLDLCDRCPGRHQSTFIHRKLFEHRLYDTSYRIISDWGHAFMSLVVDQCSYRYVPLTISVCDANGISNAQRKLTEAEHRRWHREYFSPLYSHSLTTLRNLSFSTFRPVVSTLGKGGSFNRKLSRLVLALYKIHACFSKKKAYEV
jgi:glycosyltransferase involved in cell wall biosynthesis